jgi:hypothetical protein
LASSASVTPGGGDAGHLGGEQPLQRVGRDALVGDAEHAEQAGAARGAERVEHRLDGHRGASLAGDGAVEARALALPRMVLSSVSAGTSALLYSGIRYMVSTAGSVAFASVDGAALEPRC